MKRIVIQVHVECDKCRSKVLQIAAACQGVRSVSLEGESRDQVVVTGDGVDSVCLTNKMRKKFRYVTLLTVEDMKANEGGDEGVDGAEGEQENETTTMENSSVVYCYGNYLPPCPTCYHVVYDPYPNSCSIL